MPKSPKRSNVKKSVKKTKVKSNTKNVASPKKYKMNPNPLKRINDKDSVYKISEFVDMFDIFNQGLEIWEKDILQKAIRDIINKKVIRIKHKVRSSIFIINDNEDFKDAIDILENGNVFDFVKEISISDYYMLTDYKKHLLTEALKQNKHVKTFDMSHKFIDADSARMFAEALKKNTTLNIKVGNIRREGIDILRQVLPPSRVKYSGYNHTGVIDYYNSQDNM
jgi:hypothetical protein